MRVSIPTFGDDADVSDDARHLQERMAAYSVPHRVEPVEGRVDGLVTGTHLGTASLAFVRYGAPTRVLAAPTEDTLCWTIPVQPMEVIAGRRRSTEDRAFLLSAEQSTLMIPSPRRGAVVATASADALRSHVATLTGVPTSSLRVDPSAHERLDSEQLDVTWRYISRSLALMNDPPDVVRASLGETLMTAMLWSLPDALPLLTEPESREVASVLGRRAVEWAAEHYPEPIQVTDWARGIGVSVRYLQKIVRTECDCTPSEYIRKLRLERAHHLLARADGSRTVTSIALEAGFAHVGRFAAIYRQAYGVNPAAALRRSPG